MGYVHEFIDVAAAMRQLEIHIAAFPGHMKELSSQDLLRRPAPDKWSKQEILGHLIDSALNNLKRFTEIQFLPQPYSVISYRQNELVTVNDYQNLSLGHLLDLWQALNRQIVLVVKNIPYAVIIGSKELEEKTCTIKNLRQNSQQIISQQELLNYNF